MIGNVDSKTVLQYGAFDQIEEQVLECQRVAAPGGGYILASDHSIHEGIPSACAKFMFEIARMYGDYPIMLQDRVFDRSKAIEIARAVIEIAKAPMFSYALTAPTDIPLIICLWNNT